LLQRTIELDARVNQCQRARMFRKTTLLLALGASAPALAQRTGNNAVTAADDAFGRAVGSERIGIYSTEEVRGFNPVEAGNVRIDGLYYDQQSIPSQRLIDSSSIRVGYAARGYPFPAPTGIADLQLEKIDGKRVVSVEIDKEDRENISGALQFKVPLFGDQLGILGGVGFRRANIPQGRVGYFRNQAIGLIWKPYQGASITSFAAQFRGTKLRAQPIIFTAGNFAPPKADRSRNLGQPWAVGNTAGSMLGMVAKLPFGAYRLEAGLFRSSREDQKGFAELLLRTTQSGEVGSRVVIADEDNFNESTSGEARLSRAFHSETLRHVVMATIKGRKQNRTYGGQQRLQLSRAGTVNSTDFVPAPIFTLGASDYSSVEQLTFGLGYDVQWKNRGSLGLAIQKSDYTKETRFADRTLPLQVTRDKPWLFSANGSVNIAPGLMAYGGYVRGLEESPIAPDAAVNRNEAPPAVRTSQRDAGLRYALTPKLSLIAGIFEVRKPYFNLDATTRFRQLGTISNRGAEISLAGTVAPGLTVVAGTLLRTPKIEGAPVGIGARPVGSYKRHSIANFDWKPQGQAAWSFDLAFDSFSGTVANAANSYTAPARETIALGTRYRFKKGSTPFLIRAQVNNLLNDYGWKVSSSGGYTYALPRTFNVNLSADF
jgi:iron complex outermembrane receptor protein